MLLRTSPAAGCLIRHAHHSAIQLLPSGTRAPVAPTLGRTELATYAGTYTSAELESTYRVIAGDSTLTLRTGETPGLVARAVFPDGFVSGQYTIQFVREDGRVTGFEISHPRVRGVKFMRTVEGRRRAAGGTRR